MKPNVATNNINAIRLPGTNTPALHFFATAVLFAVVCLVWATTWIGIKLTIESIPPLTAAGVRFMITFPILLAIAKATGSPLLFPKGKSKFFIFITIFYFGIPYLLMNYGEIPSS